MLKRLGIGLLVLTILLGGLVGSAWAGIFQGNYTSAQICGLGHIEIGAYGTYFPEKAFGQQGGFVGVKVTTGILDWVDVGGSYGIIPTNFLPEISRDYNGYTWGAEVKVRLLNEDAILPTIDAFGDYYNINIAANIHGISGKVRINDMGVGLIASKALGPISPFGTVSYRFGNTEIDAAGVVTDPINLENTIPFSAGVEFDLGPFQVVGEVLFIKDIQIFGAGLNLKI